MVILKSTVKMTIGEMQRNSLETASIEEEQIQPDAFGVPLHRFDLEDDWKRVAEIDGFDVKVIQNRDLDVGWTFGRERLREWTYGYLFQFQFDLFLHQIFEQGLFEDVAEQPTREEIQGDRSFIEAISRIQDTIEMFFLLAKFLLRRRRAIGNIRLFLVVLLILILVFVLLHGFIAQFLGEDTRLSHVIQNVRFVDLTSESFGLSLLRGRGIRVRRSNGLCLLHLNAFFEIHGRAVHV